MAQLHLDIVGREGAKIHTNFYGKFRTDVEHIAVGGLNPLDPHLGPIPGDSIAPDRQFLRGLQLIGEQFRGLALARNITLVVYSSTQAIVPNKSLGFPGGLLLLL